MSRSERAPVLFRLRCDNRLNSKCSWLAVLYAGLDARGSSRFIGVVQPDSWTDERAPRPMKTGITVGLDQSSLLHRSVKQVSRLPRKTLVPPAAVDEATEMARNSQNPRWRQVMGWAPLPETPEA